MLAACSSGAEPDQSSAVDPSSGTSDANEDALRRRHTGGTGGATAGSGNTSGVGGAGASRGGASAGGSSAGSTTSTGGAAGSASAGKSGSGSGSTGGTSTGTGGSGSGSTGGTSTGTGGSGSGSGSTGGTSTGTGGGSGSTGGTSGSSASGGTTSGSGGSGSATSLPASSSGCGKTGVKTGDFHLQTTDGNGTSRDYEVLVPTGYSPTKPLDLTFVYHGYGGSEDESKAYGLEGAPGASTSSIFVFPQGIQYQSYGVGWDDSCSGRDVVFFDHMLQTLEANYCIDTTRVFLAGFSWGCDHVTSLVCCRGSSIRAIAAASCTDEFANPADYKTYNDAPCPSSTKVGVRFTYDPNGDKGYSAQQFATTVSLYRSWDSCSTSSTTSGSCKSYQGCTQPFLDCGYPGMGHVLPPNWASDTWSFFSGF